MMLSFETPEVEIYNPIIDSEIDKDNIINNEYIAQFIKEEMHMADDLIILDKHDAEIDLHYIQYIKHLINLLTEDKEYSLGYFLYDKEELLLISIHCGSKIYVIEAPSMVWRFYTPNEEGWN